MKYVRSAVFLFAFFLPLHTGASNFFMILLLVASLIFFLKKYSTGFIGKRWKMLVYSTAPFFLLHVIGLLYTDFPEDGPRYLEKCISYLLVPVLFLVYDSIQLSKIMLALLQGLVYGSVISVSVLLAINFFTYFSEQDTLTLGTDLLNYYHTYYNFTKPLKIHPTYIGMFYLTALIFMGQAIFNRILRYVCMAMFGAGFLFLNSRIVFLGILIWTGYRVFLGVRFLVKRQKHKQIALYSLILGLTFLLLCKLVSDTYIGFRLRNIYQFELSTEGEKSVNFHGKSNPRMARYVSAFKLAMEKPLFGHGTADEYTQLKTQFTKDGLLYAAMAGYNAHNQFIGYAIRFGIFGLFFLLFFFFSNAKIAFKAKKYDYLLFILIVFCVNLVENYFDRNFGITFSAVIFTVFSYVCLLKKETAVLN